MRGLGRGRGDGVVRPVAPTWTARHARHILGGLAEILGPRAADVACTFVRMRAAVMLLIFCVVAAAGCESCQVATLTLPEGLDVGVATDVVVVADDAEVARPLDAAAGPSIDAASPDALVEALDAGGMDVLVADTGVAPPVTCVSPLLVGDKIREVQLATRERADGVTELRLLGQRHARLLLDGFVDGVRQSTRRIASGDQAELQPLVYDGEREHFFYGDAQSTTLITSEGPAVVANLVGFARGLSVERGVARWVRLVDGRRVQLESSDPATAPFVVLAPITGTSFDEAWTDADEAWILMSSGSVYAVRNGVADRVRYPADAMVPRRIFGLTGDGVRVLVGARVVDVSTSTEVLVLQRLDVPSPPLVIEGVRGAALDVSTHLYLDGGRRMMALAWRAQGVSVHYAAIDLDAPPTSAAELDARPVGRTGDMFEPAITRDPSSGTFAVAWLELGSLYLQCQLP
jgi:hypothetical protein